IATPLTIPLKFGKRQSRMKKDAFRRAARLANRREKPSRAVLPSRQPVGRRADFAYIFEQGEFMLKGLRCSALAALSASTLLFLAGAVWAQPAPDANSVLIYSNSGTANYSSAATSKGFTVVTATDAQWTARTTADFATFRALIIGDPVCGST